MKRDTYKLIWVLILLIVILFLLWVLLNKMDIIREGVESANNVLTILDADLCYGEKCLSKDGKDRLMNTLNSLIYKNNIELNILDTQTLGLWESDNPTDNNKSIFTIQYKYGKEDKVYDLSFNELSPMNLENYRKGNLVIETATYCYTDTNPDSKTYGKEYCVKNTDEFAKLIQQKVRNNTLNIEKVGPSALGVLDPYKQSPNADTGKNTSGNVLEIKYSYGKDTSKTVSAFDGEPLIITPSV